MKIIVAFAVLNCLFIIDGSFGLAAPTMQANEDAVTITASSHVRRDAENRNSLFSLYTCHVQKATDAVVKKLQVT